MFNFYNPVRIKFGIGSRSYLTELTSSYNNCLILYGSNSINRSGAVSELINNFKNQSIYHLPVKANPNIQAISEYLSVIKRNKFKPDCIVAIGGGSVIDTAKIISSFYGVATTNAALRKAVENANYAKKIIPVVAVPTTAGTGSETNQWAILWDTELSTKYLIGSSDTFVANCIIDPELTLTMPARLTASTGLETLCHCMEGIWANNSNSLSRMYAINGATHVMSNLETVIKNPDNIKSRSAMCIASVLSGVSLSISQTTPCHAMSYPLTLDYNIPHGIACALTLGEMYRYNTGSIKDEQELDTILAKCLGKQSLSNYILTIFSMADISSRLADYGITREKLNDIAYKSLYTSNISNNPKPMSQEDIAGILRKVY